jgi:hypothetical protein
MTMTNEHFGHRVYVFEDDYDYIFIVSRSSTNDLDTILQACSDEGNMAFDKSDTIIQEHGVTFKQFVDEDGSLESTFDIDESAEQYTFVIISKDRVEQKES